MEKKWKFPLLNGGDYQGFSSGSMDHFKGNRLSSVVREVIQNSLDAPKVDSKKPTKLHFEILKIKDTGGEVNGITDILHACKKEVVKTNENADKFYSDAIKQIKKGGEIPVLAIHDFNTEGLTGKTEAEEETGPWRSLVRASGITEGKGPYGLGSFGHGSKAPFILSFSRCILYLTYVKSQKSIEKRFQGKGILQTHKDPDLGKNTQATGFYGKIEDDYCLPLINDEIPKWATESREKVTGNQTGTTIFIPYYSLSINEEPETVISIISNFYYAISQGKLDVRVGDEASLNKDNIKSKYYEYEKRIATEQDYIDVNYVKDMFEALKALIEPDESGKQAISGNDHFEWYLKYKDINVGKTVALSRHTGMMVTNKPYLLNRFAGSMPFKIFLCAKGELSNVIKSGENPAHNVISFQFLDNAEKGKKNEKIYRQFADKVRLILDRYVKIPENDSFSSDLLDDIFGGSGEEDKKDGTERSHKVFISRESIKQTPVKPPRSGGVGGTGRHGGGRGKGKGRGGRGKGRGNGKVDLAPLIEPRVIADNQNSKKYTLWFNNPDFVGKYRISMYCNDAGGANIEQIEFKLLGDTKSYSVNGRIKAEQENESRISLAIETVKDVSGLALVGFIERCDNDS